MSTGTTPRHVDDFIADHEAPRYARAVLLLFRLPAMDKLTLEPLTGDKRLFCTWAGRRWRCTGASRFGDVWLNSNFSEQYGYQHRVGVDECSDWSDQP